MSKCKSCGRDLLPGEKKLCPACSSRKSHGWKKPVSVGTGALAVVGFVAAVAWKTVSFLWKAIKSA